jgi:PAS domain S-box-containing protein
MVWPLLTITALVALAAVHFRWRQKYFLARESARIELESLKQEHQRQSAQSQIQQAALFDSMIEGLLLLDENGKIQLANRAFSKLFGINADIRGKTILEVLRQHELTGLLEKVAAEKQVLDYELKLGGLDERWLQVNAASLSMNPHSDRTQNVFSLSPRGTSGERAGVRGGLENRSSSPPVLRNSTAEGGLPSPPFEEEREKTPTGSSGKHGTILVFHDLTRLKQLERTREEFVANVSHELRTPLSLIKGYVETLIDGAKDNLEVAARFLQTIHRNSERLQFLIEDLLTISELESGRLKMNLQRVQLRPLVEKVLEDFKTQVAARRVTLTNELPDLTAQADADRLQQVLGNLIGNALKYGRSDGHVNLSGNPTDGGMIELCVRDDGPGIPAEALDRVFERFYRVDKARSREQGGTGLGLSIVKHIVQGHGGKVWAKSEPGKGAAFFFTLPDGGSS